MSYQNYKTYKFILLYSIINRPLYLTKKKKNYQIKSKLNIHVRAKTSEKIALTTVQRKSRKTSGTKAAPNNQYNDYL